ncbi:Vps62-related protein [Pseudomonas mandelii]|uniref:Vps62-related protein n=1 Tax=Pseudomonas mandelii TaxID=75612 RepID=UPI00224ACA3E|nr:Vps62-related protein [Pseudomonas mandelii]MCX2897449.1 Vps62-related protein [Pseudomonas mandelii]
MNSQDNLTLGARRIDPIQHDNLLINFTTEFRRIWDSNDSSAKPASFWRPTPTPDLLPGYFPLGDVIAAGHENINEKRMVMVVCEGEISNNETNNGPALRAPIDFELVWSDSGSTAKAGCTIWRPIPPSGYVALGQLCSNGRDMPLASDIRCVRADLVIPSYIGDPIWNDKGSRARLAFSAWNCFPPTAMAGEINCIPGTFIGVSTYNKPETHINAYSLRVPIPLAIKPPPALPELSGYDQPSLLEPSRITQTAKLPWFVIRDPNLSPIEQLRTSPFYFLERADQYMLVGYGKNASSANQTFRWTAHRPQSMANQDVFTRISSIVIDGQWPNAMPSPFSARLDKNFAFVDSSNGWGKPENVQVATIVASHKTVAAYELHSTYRLLRENRSQVPCELYYVDGNSLHLTEYPREQGAEVATHPAPVNETRNDEGPNAAAVEVNILPASDTSQQ